MITEEMKVKMAEENIRTAIEDYGRYVDEDTSIDILGSISDKFISRLARDNYYAKQALRELFRKSQAWNEQLDAIVINGTSTHDCDLGVVYHLIQDLLNVFFKEQNMQNTLDIRHAARFFGIGDEIKDLYEVKHTYLDVLNKVAPHAYHEGRKITRVFKGFCNAIGLNSDTCSDFNRLYPQICDELTAKKIDFKLFISLNPAHFLTMSNPKHDNRGCTLTSCHSLNCNDYDYNNGCSGYARDDVSFIAFVAQNPDNPETLNNRKTKRQMYFYKPGQGILLQSRLYNDAGGTCREEKESKVLRQLVQAELSRLENMPNMWTTKPYYDNEWGINIDTRSYFGGYPDWIYKDFNAKLSIRQGAEIVKNPFVIGEAGLCLSCGDEIIRGLFCEDCTGKICDYCGERHTDLTEVYRNGCVEHVCQDCLDSYYTWCEHCECYYYYDEITQVGDDDYYCDDCLREYCVQCEDCGEWVPNDDAILVHDEDGYSRYVCENCCESNYSYCDCCYEYYPANKVVEVHSDEKYTEYYCRDCAENEGFSECEECHEWFKNDDMQKIDGVMYCSECATQIQEKEKKAC